MRLYLYKILEQNDSSRLARVVSFLLIILIIGNVVAVILASDNVLYLQFRQVFDEIGRAHV